MLTDLLINVSFGIALGMAGGLFGIGGGLIAIPILGLLFGLDQQLAQGTALVMIFPNVLLAAWRYHQRNRLNWRQVLPLVGSGFLFSFVGAAIALQLDPHTMRIAFIVFMLVLTLYTFVRIFVSVGSGTPGELRYGWPWLSVLGAAAGSLGGVFGVGSGLLATPILTGVFGSSQVVAQGLALALAAPSSLVTLMTYAAHGQVLWSQGLALAVGGLLSVSWGVKLAYALPERQLRGLFCAFLVVCSVLLFFKVS